MEEVSASAMPAGVVLKEVSASALLEEVLATVDNTTLQCSRAVALAQQGLARPPHH